MENKSIFLISNGSSSFFPKNTLTCFKNKLPSDIFIENNYEVAVESIGFSKNFKQIHIPEEDNPSFFISKSDIISYISTPRNEKDELKAKRIKIIQQELDKIAIYLNDNIHNENEEENKYLKFRKRSVDFNYDEYIDMKTFPFYFKDNETYTKTKLRDYFQKVSTLTGVNVSYDGNEDKTIFNLPFIKNSTSTHNSYFVVMHETFFSSFIVNKTCFITVPYEDFYWEPMPDNSKVFSVDRENSQVTLEISIDITEVYYKNEKYYAAHIQSYNHTLVCANVEKVIFPDLVKLKCLNVKQQIMNNTYSQDLVVFCPDFDKKDKFFYHEFDSLQYVPLSNTILKDIEISLCDEKNKLLQLASGTPTILRLSFKKMETKKESFNLRLTSAPNEQYKNNTSSSFKVVLPTTLYLDRNWKVALTSISHPNDFNTFLKDEDSRSMAISWRNSEDTSPVKHKITLKEYYSSAESIIFDINSFFEEKSIGSAKIDGDGQTVVFYFERSCVLVIGNYLLRILGFTAIEDMSSYRKYTIFPIRYYSTKSYLKNKIAEKYKPNDSGEPRPIGRDKILFCFQDQISLNLLDAKYICMYANFISPTIIAGEYHKLLRIVPIRESKTGFVITEFKHKDFYEIQNTQIKEIEIELRTHDGELINFKSKQNIILNLLFSNYLD
jgi:hypothetical protein